MLGYLSRQLASACVVCARRGEASDRMGHSHTCCDATQRMTSRSVKAPHDTYGVMSVSRTSPTFELSRYICDVKE